LLARLPKTVIGERFATPTNQCEAIAAGDRAIMSSPNDGFRFTINQMRGIQ